MNPARRRLLHDTLWAAALALVVFQGLRRWCGDRYRVPTDSMEPVLHGDPERGDIVFVDKLASAERPRRGDLVVVQHPEEPRQPLVKRIAACGDDADACWIDLRDGDVWLGPSEQRLRREVKDLPTARRRRVTWASWPSGAAAGRLELPNAAGAALLEVAPLADVSPASLEALRTLLGAEGRRQRRDRAQSRELPTGFFGSARAVDATFVERTGEVSRAGDDVMVHDCGMELRFAGEQLGEVVLVAVLEARHETIAFVWRPVAGDLRLWRDGEEIEAVRLPVVAAPASVEFGRVDDQLFFAVDRRTDAQFCLPRPAGWDHGSDLLGGPRTHVFAAVVGAPLRLAAVEVFHDPFFYRERIAGMPGFAGAWPRHVPPGTWFLLGDNAFDSRDSRHFDAVSRSAFVGRPVAVLGPWPWARWLSW